MPTLISGSLDPQVGKRIRRLASSNAKRAIHVRKLVLAGYHVPSDWHFDEAARQREGREVYPYICSRVLPRVSRMRAHTNGSETRAARA
jgi:hypothetical protein